MAVDFIQYKKKIQIDIEQHSQILELNGVILIIIMISLAFFSLVWFPFPTSRDLKQILYFKDLRFQNGAGVKYYSGEA